MKLRFLFLVELMVIACCLIHVMGFRLQADDDFISSREENDLWEERKDAEEEQKEKRLWRNWDEEKMKRYWKKKDNLKSDLYKRLWRNWSTEDDDQVEGNEMKREAEVKRLWRSQENVSDSEPLCVPCGKPRCRRSPEKLLPQGGKVLPCCNC